MMVDGPLVNLGRNEDQDGKHVTMMPGTELPQTPCREDSECGNSGVVVDREGRRGPGGVPEDVKYIEKDDVVNFDFNDTQKEVMKTASFIAKGECS